MLFLLVLRTLLFPSHGRAYSFKFMEFWKA